MGTGRGGVPPINHLETIHVFGPSTVRAEIITELILKRAGPVIFKTFLLE